VARRKALCLIHHVVLKDIQKPGVNIDPIATEIDKPCDSLQPQLETPKTAESLMHLRKQIEESC
jgi:hypothetical protein